MSTIGTDSPFSARKMRTRRALGASLELYSFISFRLRSLASPGAHVNEIEPGISSEFKGSRQPLVKDCSP